MGYHDIQLPVKYSAGSLFGPGFRTSILELDSGAETRIQRGQAAGRRSYSLERGIDGLDSLRTLYEFFLARQGAMNSFKLKDWLDYATTPTRTTHRGGDVVVHHNDEDVVRIQGTPRTYQLVTRYVSGTETIVRTVLKLVTGTVLIGDDGSLVSDSNYTIDYQTGKVTFDAGYTIIGDITAGFEFDTVVRFDESTDQAMLIALDAVDVGSLPEIRCVEDIVPNAVTQDFPFGGATNHGVITAVITLSALDGRLQIIGPIATGHGVTLPDPTLFPTGGPYFFLYNEGTQTAIIKDHLNNTLDAAWLADTGRTIWLGMTAASTPLKAWFIT